MTSLRAHARAIRASELAAEERAEADILWIGEYVAEELEVRGWTTADLAARMGGDEPSTDQLAVELLIANPNRHLFMDAATAHRMECAFGVSEGMLVRLDKACRRANGWPETMSAARQP